MQIIKNLPRILILASLVLVLGLLFFYFYFIKADIIRLRSYLKNEIKKSDIILFFPDWEKNDILALDGFPVITSKENHYINLYGFNRLFIIKNTKRYNNKSIPIKNEMLLNRKLGKGIYSIEEFRLYGFNLTEQIEKFRVSIEVDDKKSSCPFDNGVYKCGTMGWQYVGKATVDVDGQQAECIWAHPMGGKKIIIEADLPVTISGDFVFYRALASTSGFDPSKPEVITKIFINDQQVLSSTTSRNREWIKEKFSFKNPKPSRLRIEIFTTQEYKNHFCFNLEAM